jgi:Raf kinase inhibitor-like YbhB/YbcL family protein
MRMRACVAAALALACGRPDGATASPEPPKEKSAMPFSLHCAAFANGATIPKPFTGDGADASPALTWSGAPAATKAFALIMDDPDAPVGTWVHWVIYDIPATQTSLPESIPALATIDGGARQGKSSWGKLGYGGPSPPPGSPHRYFFKLYALSAPTNLKSGVTKETLLVAIKGKVLSEAQWMGRYGR